ncbi:MAG: serine/threonine-protein kinase [Haloechinothrix sp.]
MIEQQGRLIAGRYRLIEQIGSGAMGVVWRGRDELLDRTVAVKELLLRAGLAPREADRARQRSLREGRIAARLQHPHAIAVYDVADDGGRPVLIMEYLPSRSLATVLAERGTLSQDEVADLGAHVSDALAAAHAAGIIHRDVKPGNILLGADGTTKITDFGISRAVGDVTVTATGVFAGTPAFLSPEVARGADPGPASDVFSLGSTLYAAVEGAPPFGVTENAIAMLHAVSSGQVPPPRNAGRLGDVLMRMLADEPAARPSMVAVHDDLRAVAAAPVRRSAGMPAPTLVAPAAGLPPATRIDLPPARPKSRLPVLLAALALLALVGVAILISSLSQETGTPAVGPTPPGTTTPRPPATTTPPPTRQAASPAMLEQAVREYYALVPEETDEAWERLGPGLQAQGKESYQEFWDTIEDLVVTSAPQATGDTVTVGFEYTAEDRGRLREVHRLGMVVVDGVPLIDSDQLVSSTRLGGEEEGDKDEDKRQEERDKLEEEREKREEEQKKREEEREEGD